MEILSVEAQNMEYNINNNYNNSFPLECACVYNTNSVQISPVRKHSYGIIVNVKRNVLKHKWKHEITFTNAHYVNKFEMYNLNQRFQNSFQYSIESNLVLTCLWF
jgi:hypothetical protein